MIRISTDEATNRTKVKHTDNYGFTHEYRTNRNGNGLWLWSPYGAEWRQFIGTSQITLRGARSTIRRRFIASVVPGYPKNLISFGPAFPSQENKTMDITPEGIRAIINCAINFMADKENCSAVDILVLLLVFPDGAIGRGFRQLIALHGSPVDNIVDSIMDQMRAANFASRPIT